MIQKRANSFQLDWVAVILFTALVIFGYFNILSASAAGELPPTLTSANPMESNSFLSCALLY